MRYAIAVLFLITSIYPFFDVSAQKKDSTKFSSIMGGIDFSGNTSTFGHFSGITKQPSFTGYATFFSKYGFNAGVNAMGIANSDTTATNSTYEYDLNLGYSLPLGKHFTISADYSHFFYSHNSNLPKSTYQNLFDLSIGFKLKGLSVNVMGYYLNGDNNEWLNSFQVEYDIEIENFLFTDNSLTISPELGAMFSNQSYYNQDAYKTYWYLAGVALRNPTLTAGELNDHLNRYPVVKRRLSKYPKLQKSFDNLNNDQVISDLFKATNEYNLSSVSFNLPVYYSFGNFMLNAGYSITFPLNLPEYLDDSAVQYFSAGIVYTFSW